ncbi:MAG: SAM-dependent methyltransferase [Gammaproteobacteria bacterium]|nr:SAM-dependent methyltransferase [Gammaproteobacteria bacterium]
MNKDLKKSPANADKLLNMSLRNTPQTLPAPSADEIELSQPLVALICKEIAENEGKITFDKFMDLALYTPGLGYYATEKPIFGEQGDFITAPELTPLFSRCLAMQAKQVLDTLDARGDILEFGAGAGTMACDILMELEKLDCLPNRYLISEISPALRQRQRTRIATYAPHLIDRVKWIDELPTSFTGVIFGNELLDALTTHRVLFDKNGNHKELYVTFQNNKLEWIEGPPSSELLASQINKVYQAHSENINEADRYESEINIASIKWIESLSGMLTQGVIILIDYGFSEEEFYRPERYEGSLMCHYKHRAHNNPLSHIGLQDLTSHVNFTQIAETAVENNLEIMGYTTQTYFLLGCGLESLLNEIDIHDTKLFMAETQPVKQLILPDEMGELFKVIALGKNVDLTPTGFCIKNMLERL